MDSCLTHGNLCEVKRKQPRPGIELSSLIPFLAIITVTLRACLTL